MLLVSVSLFLVGALAWGLLISTIADSQQVAFQVALLTSYLPTLMLSGFIFPIASMPAFLQAVTFVVPARYFLVALRAIVLKGAGLTAYWSDLVALVVFALAVMALASLRLRRRISPWSPSMRSDTSTMRFMRGRTFLIWMQTSSRRETIFLRVRQIRRARIVRCFWEVFFSCSLSGRGAKLAARSEARLDPLDVVQLLAGQAE